MGSDSHGNLNIEHDWEIGLIDLTPCTWENDGNIWYYGNVYSGWEYGYYNVREFSLTEKTLSLQLYKEAQYLDLNNVVLISENGEEIVLTEADFAYNEEYGTYDVVAQFEQVPAYVTVRVMGNPYHDGLEDVENYVGNTRKWLETTVYQL